MNRVYTQFMPSQPIDTSRVPLQKHLSDSTLNAIAEQYGNIAELAKCVGEHLYNRENHDIRISDQRKCYQLIRERINSLRQAYEASGDPFEAELLDKLQDINNKKLRELPSHVHAKPRNLESRHRQDIILQLAHVYPGRIQVSETVPYGPFFDFTSEVFARAGIKVSSDVIRKDLEVVRHQLRYEPD